METVKQADRLLRGDFVLPHGESVKQEAREMRAGGASFATIAQQLEVSAPTVEQWVDPEKAKARNEKKRAESRASRQQRLIGTRIKEAKRTQGHVGRAYLECRKLAQTLDRALAEEQNREAKLRLNDAISAVYRAEDELTAAMKITQPKEA
jgi:predicted transcriptional regulator